MEKSSAIAGDFSTTLRFTRNDELNVYGFIKVASDNEEGIRPARMGRARHSAREWRRIRRPSLVRSGGYRAHT